MLEVGDDDLVEGVINVFMLFFIMDEFVIYVQCVEQGDYVLDWVFVGGGKVSYGSIFVDDFVILVLFFVDVYFNYLLV